MNYPESLVRHLMRTVRCSVCEATYESDDVSVLGHQDELWFVAVRCASCQTQGLIAALVRDSALEEDSGERSDGAAGQRGARWSPDPEATDPARAADRGPVTETDVEDMRDFLKDFQGGVGALLGDR